MGLVAAAGTQALLLAVLAEEAFCGAQQSHKDSQGALSIDGPS
jgi:hypothetical protein